MAHIFPKNILTIDLEDWRQSTCDLTAPISDDVVYNTENLLEILGRHYTHATFFCLGLVAKKFPGLIRKVHNEGHEIATHGWSHRPVKSLSINDFKNELEHSIKLLEDICGEKVVGHRAPDFSIDIEMSWTFDTMKELGLDYDSSIFPFRGSRYGSSNCRQDPFQFPNGLWEIPLSTVDMLGRRIPALGGGYFRLHPYRLSAHFLKRINQDERPAVVYLHPYELNPGELRLPGIKLKTWMHQGMFRAQVKARLKKLLMDYHFVPVRSYLNNE